MSKNNSGSGAIGAQTFFCIVGGLVVMLFIPDTTWGPVLGMTWMIAWGSLFVYLSWLYETGHPGSSTARSGVVYVIQDTSTGLYKIGRTTNMERRMRELGVGKTARLIDSKAVNDAAAVEKAAHKRYKDSRLPQTEYFKLNSRPRI